jgi:hypothetical protein
VYDVNVFRVLRVFRLFLNVSRQTNCMTRMISRDYHFRYHSAYYIVYHRFLPNTYTKLFSIKGCCFCCCCFQCNFPYLIVGIRAWFAGISCTSFISQSISCISCISFISQRISCISCISCTPKLKGISCILKVFRVFRLFLNVFRVLRLYLNVFRVLSTCLLYILSPISTPRSSHTS